MSCLGVLVIFSASSRLSGQDAKEALFQKAAAAEKNHDHDAAIAAYSQAIEIDPKLVPAYFDRGSIYEKKGNHDKAVADLSKAIELDPNLAIAYNNLAWILATCSEASIRDGKKAVELATKACDLTHWQERASLDSLAAACAEVGDFDNAIKWQKQMLASPGISAAGTASGRGRLAFYESHQPFHMPK